MAKIDRRELLKCLALLPAGSVVPLLGACSKTTPLPDGVPFSLWRLLRDALAQSPDYLPGRARAAIASGDVQTIFDFVRDEIALRPWTQPTHPVQIERAGHAGIRGVLRSGTATTREKAELLKHLLDQAGFASEILEGDGDFDALGGTSRFTGEVSRVFQPASTIAPLEEWLDQLNIEQPPTRQPATLDGAQLDTLAERLLSAIPPAARAAPPDWEKLNRWTSLVHVNVDGEGIYANPSVTGAVLGEHYCRRAPRVSRQQSPVPTPTLKLTLSMTCRRAPRRLETLLEGQWAMGELIGRRVQIKFLPTQDPNDLLVLPLAQLREFLPVFLVAGGDLAETDAAALGCSGDVFTADGDRITRRDNELRINGQPVALGDTDPAEAASITHIDARVNASEFPRLRIEAGFRDAAGDAVNGLPMSVFSLRDAGTPMTARLLKNLPESPRIVFALDYSSSLDDEFEGTRLAPLVQALGKSVSAALPQAQFKVGAFAGGPAGKAVRWLGDWVDSAEAAAAVVRKPGDRLPHASSYFGSLADATNSDANLVVLVTDADGSDSERPETAARISEGCPAVVIGVPGPMSRGEHFRRLAELSGGHLYLSDETDAAVGALVSLSKTLGERPYVFEMVASSDVVDDPRVTLAVPDGGIDTTLSYLPPPTPVATPRGISGLFLTVELGRRRVTRRLAGYPLANTSRRTVTQDDLTATRLALLGQHEISIEAAAPTAASALDDVVASHLSCEALVNAIDSRDESRIVAATAAGFDRLPDSWLALNTPLPGAYSTRHRSFQAGYRMILFSDVPDLAGHYRRSADILPFTDWHTIGTEDAFAQNLRHSLQLSMLEGVNFPDSAFARLADTDVVHRKSHLLNRWVGKLPDAARPAWDIAVADRGLPRLPHELLLPADPSRHAYWEVNPTTGDVLAMLPNAAGGATVADTDRKFALLAQVIDAYTEVMEALIATPPAFQVWVELEKAKLEHLRRASIAVILMDGTYTDGYGDLLAEQLEGWITDQVRSSLDDAIGGAITGYSEAQEIVGWQERAEALWNAIRGED